LQGCLEMVQDDSVVENNGFESNQVLDLDLG
jgi:hypothetical protein